MKQKSRKQKLIEYDQKYGDIPLDLRERYEYMINKYNVSEAKMVEIMNQCRSMMNMFSYKEFKIVLLEEPEGAKRPRFRRLSHYAMNNNFVHIYSPGASEDNNYMKRLIGEELFILDEFIYTPCQLYINAFIKTPSYFNVNNIFAAERGLIRPDKKPDIDNISKKYMDMLNRNVWLDDCIVVDGFVSKYYSIKPRIEIYIKYLNMLYDKHRSDSIYKTNGIRVPYYNWRELKCM